MAVQSKFNPDSEEYRLGQNILKHRKLCSMSQMDLAAAVDIDRTAISRYENGVGGEMGFRLLTRIARVLSTSVDELLGNNPEPVPYFSLLDSENQTMIKKMSEALYNKQVMCNLE